MTTPTSAVHDLSAELATLRSLIAPDAPTRPASSHRRDALVKTAIAGFALVPTVLGAIAAGAAELEPASDAMPEPAWPVADVVTLPSPAAEAPAPPVVVEAQLPTGLKHLKLPAPPALPGARAAQAPDFSFSPRFRAMLDAARPVKVASGRRHHVTLYKVAPGDTLYTIAQRTLGNGAKWRALYDANRNRVATPSLIQIGVTLQVPTLSAAPEAPTYHVAKGDSLYLIAARRLNNASRWREIAALNRAQLKGGVLIRPHQVLVLPTV